MSMTDFIGVTERVNILEKLGDLFAGRVWRERVPRDVRLPRYDGLLLKPYLIIGFTTPFAASGDRGIVDDENLQPQVLQLSTRVIGGHPDDVMAGNNAVVGLLRGWSPNEGRTTSLKVFSSGSGEQKEPHMPPISVERVSWRCTLNSAS
jgi:hypothetical protein